MRSTGAFNQWWVRDSPRSALSGIASCQSSFLVSPTVEGATLMRTPAVVDPHEADGGHAASADLSLLAKPIQKVGVCDAPIRIECPVE